MRINSGESNQDVSKRHVRQTRRANNLPTTGRVVKDTQDSQGSEGYKRRLSQAMASYKAPTPRDRRSKEVKNFTKKNGNTKNPLKKKFYTKSLPAAFKATTDWTGDAGVNSMYAARDGINDMPYAIGQYGKNMANSLDFGLDINDGDQIIGLDDTPSEHGGLGRILINALKIGGVGAGGPLATGAVGSKIGSKFVPKAAPRSYKPAMTQLADKPLEHPAVQDAGWELDLLEELGVLPGGVNRTVSGLSNPNLRGPVKPVNAPNRAKVNVPDGRRAYAASDGSGWDDFGRSQFSADELAEMSNYTPKKAQYSGPRAPNNAYQSKNFAADYDAGWPNPLDRGKFPQFHAMDRSGWHASDELAELAEHPGLIDNAASAKGPIGIMKDPVAASRKAYESRMRNLANKRLSDPSYIAGFGDDIAKWNESPDAARWRAFLQKYGDSWFTRPSDHTGIRPVRPFWNE